MAVTKGASVRSRCICSRVKFFRLRYFHQSPLIIQGHLDTYIVFAPKVANCLWKDVLSPWMMPTMASSVATPMPMPRVVSTVRRRLAFREKTAMRAPSSTSTRKADR